MRYFMLMFNTMRVDISGKVYTYMYTSPWVHTFPGRYRIQYLGHITTINVQFYVYHTYLANLTHALMRVVLQW